MQDRKTWRHHLKAAVSSSSKVVNPLFVSPAPTRYDRPCVGLLALKYRAEVSRTMQRYHAGELDAELYPTVPPPPVSTRVLQAFKGLFVRQ